MALHLTQQPIATSLPYSNKTTDLKFLPSEFSFVNEPTGSKSDSIPIIDFSLFTSANPDQRSKAINALGKACEEWGSFVLVNHGIPENVMKAIIDAAMEFFDLPDEEKREYEAKSFSDPIMYKSAHKNFLHRECINSYAHPEFHCPAKPQKLREILFDYVERTRAVARTLLQSISVSLGFEDGYMEETLKLDSSIQQFGASLYHPCPQLDKEISVPVHVDHGLLTFLIHNGVPGLQIEHNGKWIDPNSPQNSILVNAADKLEIFSDGRYKSANHRAVVNKHAPRISIAITNGQKPEETSHGRQCDPCPTVACFSMP